MGTRGTVCLMGIMMLAQNVMAQLPVVVPPGAASVEGGGILWNSAPPQNGTRAQQVYPSSFFAELPEGYNSIVSMAWRPDHTVREPDSASLELEVRLSTTSSGPNDMNMTFASNRGADDTLVYSGPFTFRTDGSGPDEGPRPFDYVVELETPFYYDPSLGNLLRESAFKGGTIEGPANADLALVEGSPETTVVALDDSATEAIFRANNYAVSQFNFARNCDFDLDGDCDQLDADSLGAAIVRDPAALSFDLTRDSLVDQNDLDEFLNLAEAVNGDGDFDGEVGFADFLTLAASFGQTNVSWSNGDFLADGVVDFSDFLVLSGNFGKVSHAVAAVPEPVGMAFPMVIALAVSVWARHARNR